MEPTKDKEISTSAKPASSSEIMQALAPYFTSGPSGLGVHIGTDEIVLRREQRIFRAPRSTRVDDLIDAAVGMSGPLTEEDAIKIIKPYEAKASHTNSMMVLST
jgi:hypothetical protein